MKKLDNKLETNQIKQTGNKRELIPFRDSSIEAIKKTNIDFKGKRFKEFKFDVSKGSSLKGLLLRFSFKTERKPTTEEIILKQITLMMLSDYITSTKKSRQF